MFCIINLIGPYLNTALALVLQHVSAHPFILSQCWQLCSLGQKETTNVILGYSLWLSLKLSPRSSGTEVIIPLLPLVYYPQRKKKTGVMYEAAIHYLCQGKRAVGIFDYESLYPQRQKTAMVSLTKMGVFWRNYFQSVSPPLFWAHWGKVGRKRLRVWKINISWWAVSDKCATYTDKSQGSFL